MKIEIQEIFEQNTEGNSGKTGYKFRLGKILELIWNRSRLHWCNNRKQVFIFTAISHFERKSFNWWSFIRHRIISKGKTILENKFRIPSEVSNDHIHCVMALDDRWYHTDQCGKKSMTSMKNWSLIPKLETPWVK